MRLSIAIAVAIISLSNVLASPAIAQNYNQITPPPSGPTVAPLPPGPQPTPNPLGRSSNSLGAPPLQQRLDSAGDKASRCLHYGATQGLTGEDLSAYSRACVNN